jgi:hypothetical protein
MAGKIYDDTESKRIADFLSNQTTELEKIESEKELTDKKTLRYTIMLTGGVLSLILLKFLISRKK